VSHDELETKAVDAQRLAYVPYSNFPVGAALESKAGEIFTGCNVEISSYGLTICAERVALFKAVSEGVTEFARIAIKADTQEFCTPCGACRQVLFDFAPDLTIVLLNACGEKSETTLRKLFPEAFTSALLKEPPEGKQ